MDQDARQAKLITADQSNEYPLEQHPATLGTDVIDVSSLSQQGLFTYDPGFISTAACESTITYIDGDAGQLLYRGYPIEQLAIHYTYPSIVHLLLKGSLPPAPDTFEATLCEPRNIQASLPTQNQSAHPMGLLLSHLAHEAAHQSLPSNKPADRLQQALDAIHVLPRLAANILRTLTEQPILEPQPNLGYINQFLFLCFGKTDIDPKVTRALDVIFTLHADHEQNASTSTVRMAGSTGTPLYAALSAGISALWGPAHGGANEACLCMLNQIGSAAQVETYLNKAKDKSDPFRLMGFGHRIYKNYDPRARIMRNICHDMINLNQGSKDPLFELALTLEDKALNDPYFIEKKLYPNVDFYSGLTLKAMGFPPQYFTVLFALARTAGWTSHWLEMLNDPHHRIHRPRQWYTGPTQRDCPHQQTST
ncbi:MAG: citrate (Si)-synthase [Legionellales bacterium]|nr:citrate (Si)-synthase [Legionellales bacterium]